LRDTKCTNPSLSLKDLTGGKELEFVPIGSDSIPALVNRTQDCELNMIGKPVFHHYSEGDYGAWLRDPILKEGVLNDRVWMTKETDPKILFEFKDRIAYQKNSTAKKHALDCPFKVIKIIINNKKNVQISKNFLG
jgi:hypothetical protein